MRILAGLASVALLGAVPLFPRPMTSLAITGATIIDGRGGAPVPDGVIIIEGGRIIQVGRRGAFRIPAGARIVDAVGRFLLPDSSTPMSTSRMSVSLMPGNCRRRGDRRIG